MRISKIVLWSFAVAGLATGCFEGGEDQFDGAVVDSTIPCTDGQTYDCLVEAGCVGTQLCTDGVLGECTPPAEICDGIDNDCNGEVDEGYAGLGQSCEAGEGRCLDKGRVVCAEDGMGTVCDAQPGDGTAEVCDGIDNDCDGAIDNGVEVDIECDTGLLGVCGVGATSCVDGDTVCAPSAEPSDEICDGLDNDCDGRADEDGNGGALAEGCYDGPEGTEGVGQCLGGAQVCTDGMFGECAGQVLPGEEICDGVDNDCNGEIDDGLECVCTPGEAQPCYSGPEGTEGVGACVAGTQTCADDGLSWGACESEVVPGVELCDGLDNDCNGDVDDAPGVGGPCVSGTGACEGAGELICDLGTGQVVCDVEPGVPSDEVCDGIDNDCDGMVDDVDGVGEPCEEGVGACFARGLTVCGDGELVCDAEAGEPGDEVCDGTDNDCNGLVDDVEGVGEDCEVGIGACRSTGLTICSPEGVVCGATAQEPAPAEFCGNTADDDCDGEVDEPECIIPCDGDADCAPDGLCEDGACVPGNCRQDLDCIAGEELCEESFCIPGNCRGDEDCADGQLCDANFCIDVPQACIDTPIIDAFGTIEGSTAEAPSEVTASCAGGARSPENAYELQLPPGVVCIDTFGSGYDTALYVRTECARSGSEIACNDDAGSLQSQLELELVAETAYYVFVDGFAANNSGDYSLTVREGPCDACTEDRDCPGNETCAGAGEEGPGICVPAGCGDGVRAGGEGCDDGGNEDGDGCSARCQIEEGFDCIESPDENEPGDICFPLNCQANDDCLFGTICVGGVCVEPVDSDGDGVSDDRDIDDDNDGIPDLTECFGDIEGQIQLVNGSLEVPGAPPGGINTTNQANVPGWSTTAADGAIELWGNGFQGVPAADGASFAELNANVQGALYQDIVTVPGTTFDIRFFHRGRSGVENMELRIGAPGETVQILTATTGTDAWQEYIASYTVPEGQALTRFEFASLDPGSVGNFIDGMEFVPRCDDSADADGDGIPNSLDLDSDGDGIWDADEAGHGAPNTDGVVDGEVGDNGLLDAAETAPDSGEINYEVADTDGNGVFDFLEPGPFPCGNGEVGADEECDDGNRDNGDGCSEDCTVEPDWECAPAEGGVGPCAFGQPVETVSLQAGEFLPITGGEGGQPFDDPCQPGEVVTGFVMNIGPEWGNQTFVQGSQAQCAALDIVDGEVTLTPTNLTPQRGEYAPDQVVACPEGAVVTGYIGYQSPRDDGGLAPQTFASAFGLVCGTPSIVDGRFVVGDFVDVDAVGDTDREFVGRFECPEGSLVGANAGRAGGIIDQLTVRCDVFEEACLVQEGQSICEFQGECLDDTGCEGEGEICRDNVCVQTGVCPDAESFGEPNDDVESATEVMVGLYEDLAVCGDDDWYTTELCPGGTLTIDVFFTHADGDIDLAVDGGRSSTSVSDDERVTVTNDGDAPTTVDWRVYGFSGAQNTYAMNVGIEGCVELCPDGRFPGECPEGFVATDDRTCEAQEQAPAVANGNFLSVCRGPTDGAYGINGVQLPGGGAIQNDPFFGNGADGSRLNTVGVWACGPDGQNATPNPINEAIGFATCFQLDEPGEYVIGLGGDDNLVATIDGEEIFRRNGAFREWSLIPAVLSGGTHIITLEGVNTGGPGGFGAEIYGPFPAGSTADDAALQGLDYANNVVFTSLDQVGSEFNTGVNSGYSCPDGFALDLCGGEPQCTRFERLDRCGLLPALCEGNGDCAEGEECFDGECRPQVDTDGDGVADAVDLDDDNDGIPDAIECFADLEGQAQLINGSLEEPQAQPGRNLVVNQDAVPGWSTTAADGAMELWNTGFLGVPSAHGSQFAELNANVQGALYQDIATVPGTTFDIRFYHRARSPNPENMELRIGAPGETVRILQATSLADAWSEYIATYTVPEGQELTRFEFASLDPGSSGNFLDGVLFTPRCDEGADADGDGIPNSLDLDSDDDGMPDAEEAGHGLPHTDGVVDGEVGDNGLNDAAETRPDSGSINYEIADIDGNGVADFLEPGPVVVEICDNGVDDDGDGLTDCDDNLDCNLDPACAVERTVYFSAPATVGGDVPGAPTRLYTVDGEGALQLLGDIRLDGQPIRVAAIALAPDGGLWGFEHMPGDPAMSRLISIDPDTAVATVQGDFIPVWIDGAAFDPDGNLWVTELTTQQVWGFDLEAGLGEPVLDFPVPFRGADLAFDAAGNCIITGVDVPFEQYPMYSCDLMAGTVEELPALEYVGPFDQGRSTIPALGFAYDSVTCAERLYAFDSLGTDELGYVDFSGDAPTMTQIESTGINFSYYSTPDMAGFPSLAVTPGCEGRIEMCGNGIDDNGDGLADCDDPLCAENYICSLPELPVCAAESFDGPELPLTFETEGAAPWFVDGESFNSAPGAASSGDINDNERSTLRTQVSVPDGGTLRFWYRVSSESCCDELFFAVNGVQIAELTDQNWTEFVFEMPAGQHVLEWYYDKDFSLSQGEDRAQIDDITVQAEVCDLDVNLPICGDGALSGDEACDDGNNDDGDGCSSTCQVEDGFGCQDPAVGPCADGQAAETVALSPGQLLPRIGGDGGGPFDDPCGEGQVVIGFDLAVGQWGGFPGPDFITRSQAACASFDVIDGGVVLEATGLTPVRGNAGQINTSIRCPEGHVVTGYVGYDDGDAQRYVAGLGLVCSPVDVVDGSVVVGDPVLVDPVGNTANEVGRFDCDPGQLVGANVGRAGDIIDQYTMRCDDVVEACRNPSVCGVGNDCAFDGEDGAIPAGFESAGAAPWFVENGVFTSGDIGDSQTSVLRLPVNIVGDGTLSFDYRVSVEDNFDGLTVLVDGQEVLNDETDNDFVPFEAPLPAGQYVIEWIFAKDGSISRDEDRVQVDNIVVTSSFGLCEADAGCAIDDDCAVGEICTDGQCVESLDFDGDGVPDVRDLDDDNDGILDTVECTPDLAPVINSSFERPLLADGAFLYVNPPEQGGDFGWTTNIDGEPVEIQARGHSTAAEAALGRQYAEANAAIPGGFYQDVATEPGTTYEWTMYHRGRDGVDTLEIRFGAPGPVDGLTPIQQVTSNNDAWTLVSGTYVVPEGQNVTRLSFQAIASAGGASRGNFIDGFTFTPVCALDTDGDGIVNSRDLDSDDDGISDADEAGHGAPNTDGVVDGDVGGNGVPDAVETSPDSSDANYDVAESDGDGLADFLDPDPAVAPESEAQCADGVDNDGDGQTDCADNDCIGEPTCVVDPIACGEPDQRIVDPGVYAGSSVGTGNDHSGSCGGGGAEEPVYSFFAARTATWCFDTRGSAYDTVLYARDTDCTDGNAQTACNDDTFGLQSQIEFRAIHGRTYFVFVDAFGGNSGDYVLNADRGRCGVAEVCDDGIDNDDDGDIDCADAECAGVGECPAAPEPACGDGFVDDGEECDDGNLDNGDGCDENCAVEGGFACEQFDFGFGVEDVLPTPGDNNPSEWSVSGNGFIVTQQRNSQPAHYSTNLPISPTYTAALQVGVRTDADNDGIGWTIGATDNPLTDWQQPYLLFYWRQGTQDDDVYGLGLEGLRVARVNGPATGPELNQLGGDNIEVLAAGNRFGEERWQDNTNYLVEVTGDGQLLQVYVDGVLEFELADTGIDGNLGFFSLSQTQFRAELLSPRELQTCEEDAAAAPVEVAIQGFDMNPSIARIATGQTVRWTNLDGAGHTVTSGVRGAGDAGAVFDSGIIANNETFEFTFDMDGDYEYFCRPHGGMNGYRVVVSADPALTACEESCADVAACFGAADPTCVDGCMATQQGQDAGRCLADGLDPDGGQCDLAVLGACQG